MKRQCKQCGKDFLVKRGESKLTSFCDETCQREYERERKKRTLQEKLELPSEFVKINTFVSSGQVEISIRTLRTWCLMGLIPSARKIGKYWYINPEEVIKWFRSHRVA